MAMDPPISASHLHRWDCKCASQHLTFYVSPWGLNSGPHTFKANTLQTNPTHQPIPKWPLTLSVHQSRQGSACTPRLLGFNQWFPDGRYRRVVSWFCIYDKLLGHVEATMQQICSTFLIPVLWVPTGPLSPVPFLALVNSFQLIA